MPYPILTLPHPFAKRLPQLLSPFELQNLQIAAGHLADQLKPNVLTHTVNSVTFEGDTSDTLTLLKRVPGSGALEEKVVPIGNEKAVYSFPHTYFNSLSNAVFENASFNNLNFTAAILTFKYSNIDTMFLEKMAARFKLTNLICLIMSDRNIIDKSIKYSTVFKIFPFINTLNIGTAYNDWVKDLLDADITTEITFLSIHHDNFDELFSFNADEFHSLIERFSSLDLKMLHVMPGGQTTSKEYYDTRINQAFGLREDWDYSYIDIHINIVFGVNDSVVEYSWDFDRVNKTWASAVLQQ